MPHVNPPTRQEERSDFAFLVYTNAPSLGDSGLYRLVTTQDKGYQFSTTLPSLGSPSPVSLSRCLSLREPAALDIDQGEVLGRGRVGDKLLPLAASALAGGECIDGALRCGTWFAP